MRRQADRNSAAVLARPGVDDSLSKALIYALLAYPLLWLLGLGGFFFIVSAVIVVIGNGILRGPLSRAVLALLGVALLSAIYGSVALGFQPDRLLGLAGNLAVWVVMAALAGARDPRWAARALQKALLAVGAAQGLLVTLMYAIYPLQLPVPLGVLPQSLLPASLAAFAQRGVVYQDWLGEAALRTIGMSGNPTWAGAFSVLVLMISLAPLGRDTQSERLLRLTAGLSSVPVIILSLSRMTLAALAVAVVVALAMHWRRNGGPIGDAVLVLAVAGAAAAVVTHFGSIVNWVSEINGAREGSAETRGAIYTATLDRIREHPFPLFGYGIKPQVEGLVASVATHSTYLGAIYRFGLAGAAIIAWIFVMAGRWAMRQRDYLGIAIMVFIVLWCLLEDFDPSHMLPLGLSLAVLRSRARELGDDAQGDDRDS